jgi:hypothetical protein
MIDQVESLWFDVEIQGQLVKEFHHQACHNPCSFTRGRAGWELFKANHKLKKMQKRYVILCDLSLSDRELYRLIQSENLKIKNL